MDGLLLEEPAITITSVSSESFASEVVDEQTNSSSPKKTRAKANPANWKSNRNKTQRQLGEEYEGRGRKLKAAKAVQPKDCSRCPRKCNISFSESDRQTIHCAYWKLGCTWKQRQFILNMVTSTPKATTRTVSISSRRKESRVYCLPSNNTQVQVCQGFFLATLHISEDIVATALKGKLTGNIAPQPQQGKQINRQEIDRDVIRDHIQSFPKVASHYCRKDTNFEYLSEGLNLARMYNLYTQYCAENNMKAAKIWLYRLLFNESNLKFHKPRKDLCDTCAQYKLADAAKKTELFDSYSAHIQRKDLARSWHNKYKSMCQDDEVNYIQFDLEAVRYCPQVFAKSIFYKRQLAVYNLTVFNLFNNSAKCYMWHEGEGGRGSSEIASCLYNYLQLHANGKPFVLFSDTCGGQNRNVNMTSLLLYAVQSLDIPSIDHLFFEPGHSMMECDSVHARIQTHAKNLEIFTPVSWYEQVEKSSARKKYEVVEMNNKFYDINKLRSLMIKNRKKDTNNMVMNWLKTTWMKYLKNEPNTFYFKYSKDEPFRSMQVRRTRLASAELELLLPTPRPISKAKASDLNSLCQSGIIPEEYHSFYNLIIENVQEAEAEEFVSDDE